MRNTLSLELIDDMIGALTEAADSLAHVRGFLAHSPDKKAHEKRAYKRHSSMPQAQRDAISAGRIKAFEKGAATKASAVRIAAKVVSKAGEGYVPQQGEGTF